MRSIKIFLLLSVLVLTANCKASDKNLSISGLKDEHNFGILVYNDEFQIYRSERLGESGVMELFNALDNLGLKKPKTIIYMNYMNYSRLFKEALQEYKIQDEYGYEFYHSYGKSYRTYLDGNNPYRPKKDIDNVKKLKFWKAPVKEAVKLFSIKKDGIKDGGVDAFYRIMDIVLDPAKQPVLFHCHGGIHRTGMIGMAVRYLQGGEWIKNTGKHVYKKKIIADNKAKKEYLFYNPKHPRQENLDFVDKVSHTEKFKKLKIEYQERLNQTLD